MFEWTIGLIVKWTIGVMVEWANGEINHYL